MEITPFSTWKFSHVSSGSLYTYWGQWGLRKQGSYLNLKMDRNLWRYSEVFWFVFWWVGKFSRAASFTLFFKDFFFDVDRFKSLYWICYNIATVLCFGFLTMRYAGSNSPFHFVYFKEHENIFSFIIKK